MFTATAVVRTYMENRERDIHGKSKRKEQMGCG